MAVSWLAFLFTLLSGHTQFRRRGPYLPCNPSRVFIVWYTGAAISLASIANDVLLTAFGVIERDLGLAAGEAGLMMSFFFLGSGAGQIVFGPLSDYIGRRITIIICINFFIAGAVVVYFSESLGVLLLGRLLQGVGCAMCQSVAWALLRDLYSGRELALQMARTFSVFAISPVLMPLLGALMLDWWDWRVIIMVHVIAGVVLLLCTVLMFKETLKRPRRLSWRRIAGQTAYYFSHRQSAYFTIPSVFSYVVLILVLSHTPGFLMGGLGASAWTYALIFSGCIGFAIIPGQWLNRWLIRRYHIWRSSFILAMISLVGQGFILLWAGIYGVSMAGLAAAMFLFSFLALAQMSNFSSLCINPHPRIAGFVSSLLGLCIQSIGALLCLLLINRLIDNDPLRWLVVGMVVSTIVAILVWFGRYFLTDKEEASA